MIPSGMKKERSSLSNTPFVDNIYREFWRSLPVPPELMSLAPTSLAFWSSRSKFTLRRQASFASLRKLKIKNSYGELNEIRRRPWLRQFLFS